MIFSRQFPVARFQFRFVVSYERRGVELRGKTFPFQERGLRRAKSIEVLSIEVLGAVGVWWVPVEF